MIVIHQDLHSVRLLLGRRDQDIHRATRQHIATPASASMATELEIMGTSSECRGMSHALVNNSRDIVIAAPTLNQGDDLYEPPEADVANQFHQMKSIAFHVIVLVPTTDTEEGLHETLELGAAGQRRRRADSIAIATSTARAERIRLSGREHLGRDLTDQMEVNEVREDRQMERGTMTIAVGIDKDFAPYCTANGKAIDLYRLSNPSSHPVK